MSVPRDVIIDCDPGIDDALALMLAAASPELRLLGVTCVAGNRPLAQTARNACRVLDLAGRTAVPVHAGCARPIARAEPRSGLIHGEDGLGGVALASVREPEPQHATDFLASTLLGAAPGSITLIALGPLTNLGLVEIEHPGVLQRARDVLIMGGTAFRRGNVTPHAEFNFYADPIAAHVVIASGAALTVFGLDVTEQAAMSREWISSLGALGSRCALAAQAMLAAYAAKEPLLHDACPVAHAVDAGLFHGAPHALSVEWREEATEGKLHAALPAPGRHANALLITGVDGARLLSLVKERIARLP
jgi:purine nucleosidase